MEYHLRISTHKKDALILLNAFSAAFKCVEMVSAFETKGTKEDGTIINPHCHSYIKYETAPTKQSISSFFKKWKHLIIKPANETAGYSHKLQKKGKEENIVYTIKGGDILINTIGNEINEYKKKTELINENKSLSSRDKIFNEWIANKNYVYPNSKYEMFKFIDEIYVLKWNKSPLAIGHKLSYSIYLLMKIHAANENNNNDRYEELLHSLYNIDEGATKYEETIEENNKKKKVAINIKKLYKQRENKYESDEDEVDFISDDEDDNLVSFN